MKTHMHMHAASSWPCDSLPWVLIICFIATYVQSFEFHEFSVHIFLRKLNELLKILASHSINSAELKMFLHLLTPNKEFQLPTHTCIAEDIAEHDNEGHQKSSPWHHRPYYNGISKLWECDIMWHIILLWLHLCLFA